MSRFQILPRRATYQRTPYAGIGVTESNNNSNPCNGQPLLETDTSITSLATDVNLPSELPVAVASIEESQNLERAADILPLIPEEDTTE
jgi:phosphoribosylcarboxyaminoimidazole (NCAIR) mutase